MNKAKETLVIVSSAAPRCLRETEKPAKNAAKVRLTFIRPATATYANAISSVYETGEALAKRLNWDLEMRLVARGAIERPTAKYIRVAATWPTIVRRGRPEAEASAVATASTAQSTISSRTATPSTRRAKPVCRIFRSRKMREITGIDVTATAMLITRIKDVRFPLLPTHQRSGTYEAASTIAKNGKPVPSVANQAICLRSFGRNRALVSAPEMNIRSKSPSQ